MVRFTTDDEARRLGEALAELRREKGLSQADAGARIGMTSQGWGLYESGRRSGLFRPDIQRRLTGALDATPEALMLKLSAANDEIVSNAPRPPEASSPGVASSGAAFRGSAFASDVRMLALTSDDMAPWAGAGVTIAYRPGQAPRPGQGCVVRLIDGRRLVRLYKGGDAETHRFALGSGETENVSSSDVTDLSAVIGRLEQ